MAKEKSIKSLIKECHKRLIDGQFKESTIQHHLDYLKNGIEAYMDLHGLTTYTPDIGQEFLHTLKRNTQWEKHYRCIGILNSVLLEGKISVNRPPRKAYELPGQIGEIAKSLLERKRKERVCEKTIDVYRRVLSQFISFLTIQGVNSIHDMEETHIVDFISSKANSRGQRLYIMKSFCKYLLTEGIVKYNLGTLLESTKSVQREKVPSVYSSEEIAQIESSIDRSSHGGRRMYAVFILASRLGLRVSDIIRLTFSNLDWDNNTISLTQYKTKREVVLPLLSDVGNAIIDYLQAERPQSNDNHIFLSTRPPYGRISRSTVWLSLQEAIRKSGVNTDRRKHGIHAFRHSLASQLLAHDTPLPIISETLGHSSTTSTVNYLRIDYDRLRSILLSPSQVPDAFYTQQGGVFYE